ncbi:hypothetical protein TUSST3_83620 [Streptomyces sp. TUS-ST3]|uniref:hypothetical protein n=1 Tax=Streptomyces sp. TUS-ST3 TaxID=3025591 RepID=UPI00235B39D6|nr:hypothetical protein [Streptomyces sp. TUS-ST3]GLP71743.1 hypothetical protein TUSST3_83620 [Streptomyces sp. TUS-ST3]
MAAELIPFQPDPEKDPAGLPGGLTYEEQLILEFCREGKGRNEIANLTGLSTWKVSTVAAKHGHYFGKAAQFELAAQKRVAEMRERKHQLAMQLLDNAELYADALSGVGTPKDGQLVAKALRDILESHELLSGGVAEGDSVEDAKDLLVGLREQMVKVRDGFESKYGVPFDSPEAAEIIKQEANQDES